LKKGRKGAFVLKGGGIIIFSTYKEKEGEQTLNEVNFPLNQGKGKKNKISLREEKQLHPTSKIGTYSLLGGEET